jgi:hypothetical protein
VTAADQVWTDGAGHTVNVCDRHANSDDAARAAGPRFVAPWTSQAALVGARGVTCDHPACRPAAPDAATPVGLQEIASLLNVARQTVDSWQTRRLLPSPEWTVGGRPAWSWGRIERWARDTGRID